MCMLNVMFHRLIVIQSNSGDRFVYGFTHYYILLTYTRYVGIKESGCLKPALLNSGHPRTGLVLQLCTRARLEPTVVR